MSKNTDQTSENIKNIDVTQYMENIKIILTQLKIILTQRKTALSKRDKTLELIDEKTIKLLQIIQE